MVATWFVGIIILYFKRIGINKPALKAYEVHGILNFLKDYEFVYPKSSVRD